MSSKARKIANKCMHNEEIKKRTAGYLDCLGEIWTPGSLAILCRLGLDSPAEICAGMRCSTLTRGTVRVPEARNSCTLDTTSL